MRPFYEFKFNFNFNLNISHNFYSKGYKIEK